MQFNLDYKEYELLKDKKIYIIIIGKLKNEIIIKYHNYSTILNIKDLSILFEKSFDKIEEWYRIINSIFNENKVYIKNIMDKTMELAFEKSKGIKAEIKLINKNCISNDISNISLYSDITKDSYTCFFNNTFIVFKTIDNLFYLVFRTKNSSIICLDLYRQKTITEIKFINNENITAFYHYLDEKNKMDLVMTISSMNNNLRIWNVKNWQCLLYINKVYNENVLYSSCLLFENTNRYIIVSNCNYFGDSELIKVFDFNGNIIKEINESNDATLLIDIYFDKNNEKNYIVTGNKNYLKSFDYNKNKVYHKYYEYYNGAHFNFVINEKDGIINLIDSCEDGNLRIWNFHSGILLKKIKISQQCLYDIILWNNNDLIIGCQDKTIRILDLSNYKIKKVLYGHNNHVITIKKIDHILFGECLISHGFEDDQIKIWLFKS